MILKPSNLYYLLAYAFRIKPDDVAPHSAESFDNHVNVLSAILINCMNSMLSKGLTKYYRDDEETTYSPHGGINFSKSIKTNTIMQNKLVCNYQIYDAQIYSNQVIKAVISKIVTCPHLNSKLQSELKNILQRLNSVPDLDFPSINWNLINYQGRDKDYLMSLHICKLFTDDLIPRKDGDGIVVRNFISEKKESALFEEFVRGYFEIEHKTIHRSLRKLSWGATVNEYLPDMELDILLSNGNNTLIIDTKYHSEILNTHYSKTIKNRDLYQINAYLDSWEMNHPDENIMGMLLYAKTDECLNDQSIDILRHKVFIRTLDLSLNWVMIKEKLDAIARTIEQYNR